MGDLKQQEAAAGTFVEPRGMIRTAVARVAGRELLGVAGEVSAAAAASSGTEGSSPVATGGIAYLSVHPDQVVLYRAKRGAFRPKATDEVIASAPRSAVRSATVDKGKIGGVLELSFKDGAAWAFDVPRVHLNGAGQIAEALGSA